MPIYEMMSLMGSIITPITLLYIFLFLLSYGRKYLRTYSRNKTLMFTQAEVKELQKEISYLTQTIESGMQERNKSERIVGKSMIFIERLFSLYNELAVGISVELYDELYVRMVLGYEMICFYKKYYKTIAFDSNIEDRSSRFMPLELLLKKWDSEDNIDYYFKHHRRY